MPRTEQTSSARTSRFGFGRYHTTLVKTTIDNSYGADHNNLACVCANVLGMELLEQVRLYLTSDYSDEKKRSNPAGRAITLKQENKLISCRY